MGFLRRELVDEAMQAVRVVYMPRAIAKMWNRHRGPGEPVTFCGWYWFDNAQPSVEGGPFKSESAAIRDAWYRRVLEQMPPGMNSTVLPKPKKRGRSAKAGEMQTA